MTEEEPLRAVASLLSAKSVRVKEQWLQQCLAFLQTNHRSGGRLAPRQLSDLVYKQYLHSDLHEIGAPALPANVAKVLWRCISTFDLIASFSFTNNTLLGLRYCKYKKW